MFRKIMSLFLAFQKESFAASVTQSSTIEDLLKNQGQIFVSEDKKLIFELDKTDIDKQEHKTLIKLLKNKALIRNDIDTFTLEKPILKELKGTDLYEEVEEHFKNSHGCIGG